VLLGAVWSRLAEGKWASELALKETSGLSDELLGRVINFLSNWNFVEIRKSPDLEVRRKAGVMSPLLVIDLLRGLVGSSPGPTHDQKHRRLAERIACRSCGSSSLRRIGRNEVECSRCSERQWFAIELDKTNRPLEITK
jgi:hypothetical protein